MPKPLFILAAGILGSMVGSFLNVCIFRLPRECMSIVKPRSRCPQCLKTITWYDNIPIVSFLVLGGKCRHCQTSISPRYLLVELLTAGLFCLVAVLQYPEGAEPKGSDGLIRMAITLYLLSAMIVVTFIDLEFRIIPNEITLSGVVLGLLVSALFPFWQHSRFSFVANENLSAFLVSVAGGAAGAGIIWLIGLIGQWIFKKEAMGFGDVKYLAMLGAFLGYKDIAVAFFLACLLGAILGGVTWLITRDRYIAFGPYLSLGAAVMLLFREPVLNAFHAYLHWTKGAP